ncbi:hypothetical protein E0H95_07565 [Pseudomonas syringae pv. tomato]|nr:hypothetical protein [Pseudomonas syringae pv. tomato]
MSAMGCEAALKPVTLAVSGTPRWPILLPVPGSSRTSLLPRKPRDRGQAKRRPVRPYTSTVLRSTTHPHETPSLPGIHPGRSWSLRGPGRIV